MASCVGDRAAQVAPGTTAVELAARLQGLRTVRCRDGRSILRRALAVRALAPKMEKLRPTLRPEDTRRIDELARDEHFLARHGIVSQPPRPAGATTVPTQSNREETCILAYYAADWPTAVPACASLAAEGNPHGHAAVAGLWLQADPPGAAEALSHAEAAARAGVRGAQLLTAALLIDATPAQEPLPPAAVEWLGRAAGQGLRDLLAHIPDGTSVSGILPLASAIDDELEAALRVRAEGTGTEPATLLPLHRAWLARLWNTPDVRARMSLDGAPGEG
ncbi:hypothetical protein ACM64Y_08960 [Novispirillum sp. DQ9]|uniref:hypothetical protein n=1 Tax=Novispirillum sp. DQ9 TaxID=3398612 RepID=UPI003C7EC706